ncbi:MAG: hypothetical protein M3336_02705 [Chloroflexota bacterium]|nr:hypothetical protein [Chloroflexota bacterium]
MRRRSGQSLWRAILALGAVLVALNGGPVPPAGADSEKPDLGYSRAVAWHLDGMPEVAAMEPTIREVLAHVHVGYQGVDGSKVDGFFPGTAYNYSHIPGVTPYYLYIRDTATDLPMVRYYFDAPALRSAIEEFLRLQYYDGAISATIAPDFTVDKATTVSDEETSTVMAALNAYDVLPDPAWLNQAIRGQSVIERLNAAMTWVLTQRRDAATRLIKRAHTTDWGDVKWEPDTDPTHMLPGDQWTISIYDQAIAYAALRGLARLNAAVGNDGDRARWEGEAIELRAAANAMLWMDQPGRGYYRVHVHVPPDRIRHQIDEAEIIAIGNAAAIYYGLAEPDKVARILGALDRARVAANAPKPGLALSIAYPGWYQAQMAPRQYQNGALWDWWAGRQISAEFWSGYWRLAREHLGQLARDWASHPGQVREWESPWLQRVSTDHAYGGAASVVGQAVVEGLFGVDITGREVQLTPRLDEARGGVRVYQPSNDLYAAYEYQASERQVTIQYGSNSPTALSVRLPVRWRQPSRAVLDDKDSLPVAYERVGEMTLARVTVPSGQHRVDLLRVPRGREKF